MAVSGHILSLPMLSFESVAELERALFAGVLGCFPFCKTDRSENSGPTTEKWNDIFRSTKPMAHSPAWFLSNTNKMEDLSVGLFGEDSEESEILYELVEESDDL